MAVGESPLACLQHFVREAVGDVVVHCTAWRFVVSHRGEVCKGVRVILLKWNVKSRGDLGPPAASPIGVWRWG